MNCPKCGNKCKVVQTHKFDKAVIEQCAVQGPNAVNPNSTVEMGHKVVNKQIIKRKQKCLTCGCYFWTKETFDGYTEEEIRKGWLREAKARLGGPDEDDTVYCIPPERMTIHVSLKRGNEVN